MAKETKIIVKTIKKADVKQMITAIQNNIKLGPDEILVFECNGGNIFFGKVSGKITIYEEVKK